MTIIACVDDNMGMAFNSRRQSRDSAVIARIRSLTAGNSLWVSPYTAKLFDGDVLSAEDFLERCGDEGFAFTELEPPGEIARHIERIVLYRWNRTYPADVRFNLDLTGWKLVSVTEFPGTSHEKITEEIYAR